MHNRFFIPKSMIEQPKEILIELFTWCFISELDLKNPVNLSLTCKTLHIFFHRENLLNHFIKLEKMKINQDLENAINFLGYDKHLFQTQDSYFIRYTNDIIFAENKKIVAQKAVAFFKDIKQILELEYEDKDFISHYFATEHVKVWENRLSELNNNPKIDITNWFADVVNDDFHAFDYHPLTIPFVDTENAEPTEDNDLDWGKLSP